MEFHVTEEAALARRPQLTAAGAAMGLPSTYVDVDSYAPGTRDDFAQYLDDHDIEFFSVAEIVTPHHPSKAHQAGFEELVPPLHLWPWSLLVLRLGDEMRSAVGHPVALRNLYRPMSYNQLVASSGIMSDHPNACAGDFDFHSEDARRTAESVIRGRAASDPSLEVSLGMGARTLHVGVMSPIGARHWFYDSYSDPRQPLVHGTVLDESMKIRIIEQTAVHESDGDFGAMNRDGEFRGEFNRPGEEHPAFGRYHIGLSYGIIQFTQDSGALGELLEEMRRRDATTFRDIFGPSSDALVDLTRRSGPSSRQTPPRGPRVQPLDGADLWEDVWVERFRAAADHVPFQEAQMVMAARIYLDPMVQFAAWLGLDTDRALGMVFDRAVQMGRGGARHWIMQQVGPIDGDDMLRRVLDNYGFATVRDFQATIDGLATDGAFGPLTHAALCFFERQRPDDAPFVMHVPGRETMLDMLVIGARSRRWGQRVEQLRTSSGFEDVPLDLS